MNMQIKQPAPQVRGQESCAEVIVPKAENQPAKSNRESAEDYVGVITQLDASHRLILCKDAIQWIIQVKRGHGRRHGNWRGRSYITCPKAVIKVSDALCGPLPAKTIDKLQTLPLKPGVTL